MKIALLSTGFLSGREATAITLTDFSKELVEKNHKVTVFPEIRKSDLRHETRDGLEVYRIGSRKFRKLSFINRILGHGLGLRKIQKKHEIKFDVIHGFSAAPILVLRTIFAKIFCRNAITVHTLKSYSREKMGQSFFGLLNGVDYVTVPSKRFARILENKGVKKNKIKIIRSHINTHKFKPRNKKELKEKYDISNRKIVLYYGSLWKMKGTDILLKAIPKIIQNDDNVQFIIASRHFPYPEEFQTVAKEYPNNIKLIDKIVNIEEYVSMADAVVLPYHNLIGTEGNPSCLLEAMASKTAVVTTNLPELREIAENEVHMAKPSDVNSLTNTILDVINHPNFEMLDKAYLKSQEFSTEKISKQFLELYQYKN
tara:strand:- start:62043 stop:63152 length:1110 start_codon:yes stop_codon:yes gene_type:complete